MAQEAKQVLGISAEIAGGLALVLAAVAALLVVNLGGAAWYAHLLHHEVTMGFGPLVLTKTLHHWVNDGLMVLFFLVVGIEIHREIRHGHLQTWQQAALPAVAAVGGFVVPALVYAAVTWQAPEARAGWSVPTATDIAFAVAVVMALGKRVPVGLRVFLLALAVVDDLLAIGVIAVFYTDDVVWMNLLLAAVAGGVFWAKRRWGFHSLAGYLVVGVCMWVAVLESGVHATVAGVLMGLLLPLERLPHEREAPALRVEHALQPWVRWLVLPAFAFMNVGVDVRGMQPADLLAPVTLGIVAGLVVGKQVGVLGTVWLMEMLGAARRPAQASWWQMYGVAALCGIGFTMSLFIGALAFPAAQQDAVRLGVIVGSVVAAAVGVGVLRR